MVRDNLHRLRRPASSRYHRAWMPSGQLEYAYFMIVAYSILSTNVGIELPIVAAGFTVLLSVICLAKSRRYYNKFYHPIALPLACFISFILIQIIFHGNSVTDPAIRAFILLICGMIILQTLRLRKGFLQRYTFVIFLIGAVVLPHVVLGGLGSVERAAADIQGGGNLRNANGLAGWFGFCALSFAVLGSEARKSTHRGLYWLLALGCLVVVGLTVSRGVIFAVILALLFVFRRSLKRGFVPLLLLFIVVGVSLETGVVHQLISRYEERGMEETGRFVLWPYVLARIMTEPWVGVGVSKISIYVPEMSEAITTPHNAFLYFALASGVVPFAFWLIFWLRAGWESFFNVKERDRETAFRLPFFIYIFVNSMFGDINTDPWVLLLYSVCAGSSFVSAAKGVVPRRTIPLRRRVNSGWVRRASFQTRQRNRLPI